MMGTRSGDLDPRVLLHLMNAGSLTASQVEFIWGELDDWCSPLRLTLEQSAANAFREAINGERQRGGERRCRRRQSTVRRGGCAPVAWRLRRSPAPETHSAGRAAPGLNCIMAVSVEQ